MGAIDFFWHLLNFILPAFGVASIAAALAKLFWRKELAAVPWRRLTLGAGVAGFGVLVLGLLLLGRDGRIVTYAALVLANAAVLWWLGFGRR